jgi:phosphoribosylformylglycinamidine synthase
MATPRVLILRAPGTNCDRETAYAFERVGAETESMHINRLREEPAKAQQCQILCIPGGFSYGDDIGAGRIFASQLRHHLTDVVHHFQSQEKLVLGICNGFQVLVQTGLLAPNSSDGVSAATLTDNDSGKFEDRWVELQVDGTKCVMLAGIDRIYLPIAHAEGKFVPRDATTLESLDAGDQLALRYACSAGNGTQDNVAYPANPNGSVANVAGMCDTTGRVFGLMPHPERFIDRTQHPRWTREELPEVGDGLRIFENAVRFWD